MYNKTISNQILKWKNWCKMITIEQLKSLNKPENIAITAYFPDPDMWENDFKTIRER